MKLALALSLAAVAGCEGSGSSVLVKVSAASPLSDVASLHVHAFTSLAFHDFDIPLSSTTIPPEPTFGIEVPPSIQGLFSVDVQAIDSTGKTIGTGSGSTQLAVGESPEIDVTLMTGSSSDMGADGGASVDMRADLSAPDLATPDLAPRTGPIIWSSEVATNGSLHAIYVKSRTDIWAAGAGGLIIHSSGDGKWSGPLNTGTANNLRTIWGDRVHSDIWAAGDNNTLIHSTDGTNWSQETFSGTKPGTVFVVWGTSNNDVFAIGNGAVGLIIHSVGNGVWSAPLTLQGSTPNYYFGAIGGTAGGYIYASSAAAGDVWVGSGLGSWSKQYTAPTPPSVDLTGIVVPNSSAIYVSSNTGIFFSTGNGSYSNIQSGNFGGIFAVGSDFYLIDNLNAGVLLQWGGSGTTPQTVQGGPTSVTDVDGSEHYNVFVVNGGGTVFRGQ